MSAALMTELQQILGAIIGDFDALSPAIRAAQQRMSLDDPLMTRFNELRLNIASLRATAHRGVAVIGAIRMTDASASDASAPVGSDDELHTHTVHHSSHRKPHLSGAMAAANDHSLDPDPEPVPVGV